MAAGEYIWIAESDDYADPTFLEKLVARLDAHPAAGIAYCQSWRVGSDGEQLGSNASYTELLDAEHWSRDYVNRGTAECADYMFIMNTIPNASAALLRRNVVEQVGYATETMRLCGDHHLWVKMLLVSDIVYLAEHLNYFRCHAGSVRSDTYRNGIYLEESYRVRQLICGKLPLAPERRRFLLEDQARRWYELTVRKEGNIPWRRNLRIWREGIRVDPWLGYRLLKYIAYPHVSRMPGFRRLQALRQAIIR